MNESVNICLPCGLCCDGSLIGHVQLDSKELPDFRKVMNVEEVNDKGFFLQPCNNYCNGCTIYSNRPKQCASFSCELLASVEQKELDFNSAIVTINEVKQKKYSIEQKVEKFQIKLQSESFYFKMVELKNLLQKKKINPSLTQNQIELISDLEQLDKLLLKTFGVTLD